jgi:hypothetical protein
MRKIVMVVVEFIFHEHRSFWASHRCDSGDFLKGSSNELIFVWWSVVDKEILSSPWVDLVLDINARYGEVALLPTFSRHFKISDCTTPFTVLKLHQLIDWNLSILKRPHFHIVIRCVYQWNKLLQVNSGLISETSRYPQNSRKNKLFSLQQPPSLTKLTREKSDPENRNVFLIKEC